MTLLAIVTSIVAVAGPYCAAADTAPNPAAATAPVATPVPWSDSLELGASTDSLTNAHPPSSQTYLSANERGPGRRASYYEQWVEQNQYGLHDRSFMLGNELWAAPHTLVGAQLSLSPTHNVLPSFDGTLNVEERFGAGFGTALAYERRTYSTVNASTASLAVDRYFGQYRAEYKSTFAQLAGTPGTAVTHALLLTRYDNHGGDATLNWYAGRDVESAAPASVLVLSVSGFSLSGHQIVVRNLAIAYGFEEFNEGSLYSAIGFHLGLRHAF